MKKTDAFSLLVLAVVATFVVACGSSSADKSDASADPLDAQDSQGADAGSNAAATALTGKLGSLGDVKPTASSWVISNSGETLIYLSSAPLTCAMLQTEGVGWLSSVPSNAQVIEIVVKGDPKVGTVSVGPAEVNYAPGGMSSAHEKGASSGSVTFKEAGAKAHVSGSLMGTFSDGTKVSGTFSADFCPNGSQY